ncbi:MAG: hypothetical protein O7J95_04295, partial [Planctomycetota bacterium]|nr:hypothetical protein [Planctomycetota bacterium]
MRRSTPLSGLSRRTAADQRAAAWSDARGPEPSRAYEVWSSVYTVELQGTRNVRRHRGYLAHKTTRRHPEGYYEVLD